jgi:type IV secretory pathway VirB10-like protein
VRKRSFRFGPALIGSLALHVAVIGLLVFEFPRETKELVLSAVPVDIVSEKQQEAGPAPETKPQPAPTPEPPQPQPPQPAPPQPDRSPKPPDRQPSPDRRNEKSLDLGKIAGGSPDYRPQPPRPPASHPGQGQAAVSTGPDVDALRGMFGKIWSPNCPAPGADNVQIGVRIRLRSDGYTVGPAVIENPHPGQREWDAAAERAAIAAKALRYRDLTPAQLQTLAGRGEIYFKIDQRSACRL